MEAKRKRTACKATQHTLKQLRDRGCVAQVVERWIPQTKQRKDLFGIIDVLGILPTEGRTIGVQTTSAANLSSRMRKCESDDVRPVIIAWLLCNNELEFHGWKQSKPRAKWTARIVKARLDYGAIVFDEVTNG